MKFSGFPSSVRHTPVPDPLFGPLLEEIEDLAELKVTLRACWLGHQKRGPLRLLSQEEFLNDRVLARGLASSEVNPRDRILQGLGKALKRQTLLLYQPDPDAPEKKFYLLNTADHRRALARLKHDNSSLAPDMLDPEDGLIEHPAASKPNIFAMYEDNIGMLSPMLADELKEAEELYSWDWISEAFKIGVTQNKRSWSYISAILRRWAAEGKDHGESGGHSQADNRTKYLEEYQRRRGHLPWERTRG